METRLQVPRAFRIASGDALAPVYLDVDWRRVSAKLVPLLRRDGVRFFFVFDGRREVEVTESVRRADWSKIDQDREIPIFLLVPEVWEIVERKPQWDS